MLRATARVLVRRPKLAGNSFKAASVPPISSFAHSIKRFSTSLLESKETEKKMGTKADVTVSHVHLKQGYQRIHQRFNEMFTHAVAATVLSPTVSAVWLQATEQLLADSPLAMSSMLVGGLVVASSAWERKRINQYVELSALINTNGPAASQIDNQRMKEIIAGDNPKVKFISDGLKVSGTIGNVLYPSSAMTHALSRIHQMQRVVLLAGMMGKEAEYAANLTFSRWIVRINAPLAILNILASENRMLDDFVALVSSSYNLVDYFSGSSVAEARDKFTRLFSHCHTTQEVISVLIDNKILDDDAMSFLTEWIKNQDAVGVRVGRTAVPVLYKQKMTSYGGPYPMQLFPQHRPSISAQAPDDRKDSLIVFKK